MGKRAWGLEAIAIGCFILAGVAFWFFLDQLRNSSNNKQCQVPVVVNVYGCCGNGTGGTVIRPRVNSAPKPSNSAALKPNVAPAVVEPQSPCPLPSPVPPAVIGPQVPDNRGQLQWFGPGGGGSNIPIRQVPELSPLMATGLGMGLVIAAMWR